MNPCPHCSYEGPALVVHNRGDKLDAYVVRCPECGWTTETMPTRGQAEGMWNWRRAEFEAFRAAGKDFGARRFPAAMTAGSSA